jgi:hypothetical protein
MITVPSGSTVIGRGPCLHRRRTTVAAAYSFFDTPAIPADLLASSNWRFSDLTTDNYGHGIAEIPGGCGAVVGGGTLMA